MQGFVHCQLLQTGGGWQDPFRAGLAPHRIGHGFRVESYMMAVMATLRLK